MKRVFLLLVAPLVLAACDGAPTLSDVTVAEPDDTPLPATYDLEATEQSYGSCPDPFLYCEQVHPGSTLTAFCGFGDCFEMNYGREMRIVAADEQGEFPKSWSIWHDGVMSDEGLAFPCILTAKKHKTIIEIPETEIKCAANLRTGGHLYFEHFASNPETGCLGWLECRSD